MQHGRGELAECGDGLAGAEDVSEEARGGGAGVLEDFGEEVEGCSSDAFEGHVAGEELIDGGTADVFGIRADSGKTLEVVGGEVGEGVREGAKVVGGESERSLHRGLFAILMLVDRRCPRARHRETRRCSARVMSDVSHSRRQGRV